VFKYENAMCIRVLLLCLWYYSLYSLFIGVIVDC